MELKEKAKVIRQRLKNEMGLNSKKVSVSINRPAIIVRLKDLTADIEKVNKIAKGYEKVDRCEYSGEILAGGNDFVRVEYHEETLKEAAKQLEGQAKEIESQLEAGEKVKVYDTDQIIVWAEPKAKSGRAWHTIEIIRKDDRKNDNGHIAHNYHSIAEALAKITGKFNI